jgi:hypothetical protein
MSSQTSYSFLETFETFLDNLQSSSLTFQTNATDFIINFIESLNESLFNHEDVYILIHSLSERYFEYKHIHLIANIIIKWCNMSSTKFQVFLIRTLFQKINLDSVAITHNVCFEILQQLLKNPLLKDEIVCQALQHNNSQINLNLLCFILTMRHFNFDETSVFSKSTILEFIVDNLLWSDEQSSGRPKYTNNEIEVFHYLLKNTKIHVNNINIYAACAHIYDNLSKPVFIQKFFIDNNEDLSKWINSCNFYKQIKKQPFRTLEELKEILSEFCKTNQDAFLLMSDINNKNILSYCYNVKVLKELWESDCIPEVLKRDYKDGCFVRYNPYYFEKINNAYYIHNNNSLERLFFVHFFPIHLKHISNYDNNVSKVINEKCDQFCNIAGKKLPINLCKKIYNHVISTH